MKEFCKKHGITENQFKGIEKIEGSLNLRSLTSIPKGSILQWVAAWT